MAECGILGKGEVGFDETLASIRTFCKFFGKNPKFFSKKNGKIPNFRKKSKEILQNSKNPKNFA
jgi:hypothetical protein